MTNRVFPWFHTIISSLEKKAYSHAYILSGNEGLGKRDFSYIFSQILLCSKSELFLACNECKSCHLFLSKTHPDFYEIDKEKGKKNISINQIKEIKNNIHETSFLNGSKVFLILSGETMTKEANNALLKSLEEPPKNTYFILVSDSLMQIPITVKSRCFELNVPSPNNKEIKQWITDLDIQPELGNRALRLTSGNVMKAAYFLENGLLEQRTKFIKDLGEFIKRGDNLLDISQAWSKEITILTLVLEWMSILLMDCLRFKTKSNQIDIQEDSEKISEFLGTQVKQQVLYNLLEKTNYLWSIFKNGSSLRADYQLKALLIEWGKELNISPR